MFDLLSLQGLRFSLKLATTIELKQGLEPNFLKLLRMLQLVPKTANIKLQRTGAEVAYYAEAMARF
jgi:hypothetical protein